MQKREKGPEYTEYRISFFLVAFAWEPYATVIGAIPGSVLREHVLLHAKHELFVLI